MGSATTVLCLSIVVLVGPTVTAGSPSDPEIPDALVGWAARAPGRSR